MPPVLTRGETWTVACLTACSLLLRVSLPGQYPWGLHSDELGLYCAAVSHHAARSYLGTIPCGLQVGLYALLIGPVAAFDSFLALRAPSILGTAACVPLGWWLLRRCGASEAARVLAASLYVVMPWSLLYGRVSIGGEVAGLVLAVLLLLDALGRDGPPWRDVALAYGLWCAVAAGFWMYAAARVTLVMLPSVLLSVQRPRRCAVALLLGLTCVLVGLTVTLYGQGDWRWYGLSGAQHGVAGPAWNTAVTMATAEMVLHFMPLSTGLAESVGGAAFHPWPILAVAAVGVVVALTRRELWWLVAASVLSVAPAILQQVSARRLLAFDACVPLFVALGFDWLARGRRRALYAAVAIVAVTLWAVPLYFSDTFWTLDARRAFCEVGCTGTPIDFVRECAR